jgi:hypothetical protein
MLLGRPNSADQAVISAALRQTPGFAACQHRLWWEHSAGLATGFADAGSRDKEDILSNLSRAFGRRRTNIDILREHPEVLPLLEHILSNTTPYAPALALLGAGTPSIPLRPSLPELATRILAPKEQGLTKEHSSNSLGDGPSEWLPPRPLSPTPPRVPSAAQTTVAHLPMCLPPTPPLQHIVHLHGLGAIWCHVLSKCQPGIHWLFCPRV